MTNPSVYSEKPLERVRDIVDRGAIEAEKEKLRPKFPLPEEVEQETLREVSPVELFDMYVSNEAGLTFVIQQGEASTILSDALLNDLIDEEAVVTLVEIEKRRKTPETVQEAFEQYEKWLVLENSSYRKALERSRISREDKEASVVRKFALRRAWGIDTYLNWLERKVEAEEVSSELRTEATKKILLSAGVLWLIDKDVRDHLTKSGVRGHIGEEKGYANIMGLITEDLLEGDPEEFWGHLEACLVNNQNHAEAFKARRRGSYGEVAVGRMLKESSVLEERGLEVVTSGARADASGIDFEVYRKGSREPSDIKAFIDAKTSGAPQVIGFVSRNGYLRTFRNGTETFVDLEEYEVPWGFQERAKKREDTVFISVPFRWGLWGV